MVRWVVGSILYGVDPLSYFSFQPVLHDWCNKGRGMYYPVCGMVHIKEPLLLIDKSSLCGGSGFPFSLSEWSLTICLTPYNRRYNVLSASLNKTFLSLILKTERELTASRAVYNRSALILYHNGRNEGNGVFNDALNTFYLDILYAPSHRHDSTYLGLCYTSRGSLAGIRNRSMRPTWGIDPTTHRTMSERSYHGAYISLIYHNESRLSYCF